MTRYGIEVSQGADVEQTSAKDKIFSSEFQSPKVSKVYSGSFTSDSAGRATVKIPHGLTYAPVVLGYYKGPDNEWQQPDNSALGIITDLNYVTLMPDPTAYGSYNPLTPSTVYQYKFWVFLDPAQAL